MLTQSVGERRSGGLGQGHRCRDNADVTARRLRRPFLTRGGRDEGTFEDSGFEGKTAKHSALFGDGDTSPVEKLGESSAQPYGKPCDVEGFIVS